MKFIKTYEKYKIIKKYWKVPTGEKYLTALKKIGCDSEVLNNMYDTNAFRKTDYIYILCDMGKDWVEWGWVPFESLKWIKKEGHKYQGEVIVEPHEIDANKYNL